MPLPIKVLHMLVGPSQMDAYFVLHAPFSRKFPTILDSLYWSPSLGLPSYVTLYISFSLPFRHIFTSHQPLYNTYIPEVNFREVLDNS